jgi:hypothetical protein
MKWTGQHIYDLIARFRNSVYLEDLSTSTETDMLVVDSSGKISKRAIDAIDIDVSDFMSEGSETRVLTSSGTDTIQAEEYFTFGNTGNVSTLGLYSDQDTGDFFTIKTTTHGATQLTTIDDNAAAAHLTLNIDGDIKLDTVSGTNYWYKATNTADYLKLDIGADGEATFTTVDANAQAAHLSLIADGHIKHSSIGGYHVYYKTGNTDDYFRIAVGNNGDTILSTTDDNAEAGHITIQPDGDLFLSPKTGKVKISDPDNDDDHTTIQIDGNGGAKITTYDAATTLAGFEIEADGDITLDAAGSIYNEADAIYFTSTSTTDPILNIKNFVNDAHGARLRFTKDKGGVGADGDDIGTIEFYADNTAQELTNFASIVAEVSEADDTDEAGKLTLNVAESDGTTSALSPGLILEGEHATDGQVDVTIANGVASTTTVAGNLDLGGQLKKRLHYIHTAFKANNAMDTERYVSLVDSEREATGEDNVAIVAIMPGTGVLKRVIWNTSSNLSAKSWTFKFKKIPSGTAYTSEVLVATVTKQATSGMSGSNTNSIIDFTTDASDADNACTFESGFSTSTQFSAGDRVLFSFESNTAPSGQPKCNLTFVFELDDSTVL